MLMFFLHDPNQPFVFISQEMNIQHDNSHTERQNDSWNVLRPFGSEVEEISTDLSAEDSCVTVKTEDFPQWGQRGRFCGHGAEMGKLCIKYL